MEKQLYMDLLSEELVGLGKFFHLHFLSIFSFAHGT